MPDNLERMLQLVGEFFDTRNDPDQLDVTDEDRKRLLAIHPATMLEYVAGDGPVLWVLIIPTIHEVMDKFVKGEISETQLLYETPIGGTYDAIYLCSAAVLPEYRRKGMAKKITVDAINEIRAQHPVKTLFSWSFSPEGETLAETIAAACHLPLLERAHKYHSK